MARRQGSIRKLGEDRWLIRWYLGEKNGKREYGSEVVHGSKKFAQDQLTERHHSLTNGTYVRPAKDTVGQFLDRWEADIATRVSAKTFSVYRSLLATHIRPVVGNVLLRDLDVLAVQELVNGMTGRSGRPLSARTRREALRVLRQALAAAVRWKLVARNPTEDIALPKHSPRAKRPLTAEEVQRFRAATRGSHFELAFDVMLASGMRPGELLGLSWSCVDFEAGTVSIQQTVA